MDSLPPYIFRWRNHPAFSVACLDPAFVAELRAYLLYCHASLSSVLRWNAMFSYRALSQAHMHRLRSQLYDNDMGMTQYRRLHIRSSLCDLLILRLNCFRGVCSVGNPQHHFKCIALRRHFLVSKDIEDLFQEGQRLCEQQRFSEAAMIWGKTAILQHAASHAYLSNMLFEGRPDVPKDLQRALELASIGATMGCAHSKGILSRFLVNGIVVDRDVDGGLKLARESAAAGSCFGQYMVGMCYETGRGVLQDYGEAFEWFQLAAAQKHIIAQYNLGILCKNGTGVVQNNVDAVRWFTLAAEDGYVNAQYNLGVMYENGRGVTQDDSEAKRWFRLAAKQGHAHATIKLVTKKN
jgi:TPR repeat protein